MGWTACTPLGRPALISPKLNPSVINLTCPFDLDIRPLSGQIPTFV
jgi:hypothetical protein